MKIAITGSIGSGKSMVCQYLAFKGYDVFDCDYENRKLLEKDQEGYLRIKEAFPDCFDAQELNKKKLASVVFNNEEARKELEGIMHPLILKRLFEREDDPLFAEVPLLFEVDWDVYFDHNLLVVTDYDLLIERLQERGLSAKEAMERLNDQMSVEEKAKRADKIIYNNGSLNDLYQLIDEWLNELKC